MYSKFYRSFEDQFRGSEELIRNRHQNYANFFLPIASQLPGSSIFDAGCGRGEWIELMASNGFNCHGVDINPKMINPNQKSIKVGNALEELKSLKRESQVIISSFHMVEHLQPTDIQEFIHDSFTALMPGGILIIETPNIENLSVASNSFWLDPTHIRPVNMVFLKFLCEEIGFYKTLIARFNEDTHIISKDRLSLNDVLFKVSPDIALVAQKGPENTPLVNSLSSAFSAKYGFSLEELSILYDYQRVGLNTPSNWYDYQKNLRNKISNLLLIRKLTRIISGFKIKVISKN